eukprot:scaffold26291_cov57-Phaeocystis_antarctica.AAC.6
MICLHLKKPFLDIRARARCRLGTGRDKLLQHGAVPCVSCWVPLGAARVSLGAGAGMVGALRTLAMLSLATVVRGDFRVKFEVEVRSGTKEFTVLVHEDWAPSMPPTARTPY